MSSSPRPLYFISRGNGILTPLIAADELPSFIKIASVPATISIADTANMQSLGEKAHSGQFYGVELTGNSPINALEKLSPKATDTQTGLRPAAEAFAPVKRFRSPDAEVVASTRDTSGVEGIENWRHGVMTADDTQVHIFHSFPKERTLHAKRQKAVIDEVVAANEKQVTAVHEPTSSTPTPAPQSRTQAAVNPGVYGKKVYCTYWLKTGNCHYQQQGCLYKHEMPDNKTLNEIGVGRRPDWHIKQFGYDWKPEKEKVTAIEQPWRAPANGQARPAPHSAMNGFGRKHAAYGQACAGPTSPGFLPLAGQQQENPVSRSPGCNVSNVAAQRSPPRGFMSFSSRPTNSPNTDNTTPAAAFVAPTNVANNYMAQVNTATAVPTAAKLPANAANMYIASRTVIAKPTTAKMQQPLPLTSEPAKSHNSFPRPKIDAAPKPVRPIDTIKPLAPSSPSVSPIAKASNSGSLAAYHSNSNTTTAPSSGFNAGATTDNINGFVPPSPNPLHRRYFVAPGEPSFVQNSKEEKPGAVEDDWMVREKKAMTTAKAKQEAATTDANVISSKEANGNANNKPSIKGIADANGHTNGNGYKGRPAAKAISKNPPGKTPRLLKQKPKAKSSKGKSGVKGRGAVGVKLLDKEEAVVQDLLVDFDK